MFHGPRGSKRRTFIWESEVAPGGLAKVKKALGAEATAFFEANQDGYRLSPPHWNWHNGTLRLTRYAYPKSARAE